MLAQLRKSARNLISAVIIGILVIAFAIWGVSDVFRGGGIATVAKVAGRTVSPRELSRELDLTLKRLRNEGRNVTQQEAIEAGVHRQLLDGMVARLALSAYAERLGVSASDGQVARQIREMPSVQNPLTNAFDRTAYAELLRELGYSQTEFEEDMRQRITTAMIGEALTAGARAPSSYGAVLLAYDSEQRTISVAEARANLVGAIAAPTDAQIQEFYEENRERLRVPEYRTLTLAIARPADFAARVEVPEERIREDFEARRASLETPERRTFDVVSAPNEAQAREAARRLGAGEDPQAVARALGVQAVRAQSQPRTEVVDSGVREAVFAMGLGEAPRVVRAQLADWAAVRLTAVEPAQAPDYEAARQRLRDEIALAEASDLLNEAIGAFEDARSAGANLAEAARAHGLAVVEIPAVDAEGRDQAGQPVAAVAGQEELLETAFETPEGESSDFIPGPDSSDLVVSVDRVIAETTRPLEAVRADLALAWTARERARRLREIGEAAGADLRAGRDFAAVARNRRLTVIARSQVIDRQAASQLPARGLGAAVFEAPVGGVAMELRVDGGSMILVKVEAVTRADPGEHAEELEQFRLQMQQALEQSLMEAATAQVVADTPRRVNERTLTQLFGAPSGEDDDAK